MTTCHSEEQMLDAARLKRDFPMLTKKTETPLVYLDTAATAQKPRAVIDAICRFYKEEYATVHRAVYKAAEKATTLQSEVRRGLSRFINAKHAEEIVFTKGTTESINLVAHSFAKRFIKVGDEILISEMEHHANIVPWHLVCQERGAVLKIIPITDLGEIDFPTFQSLLNPKTKLVSLCHVANTTGTINPIKKIALEAHQVGAKVLVDGAQAASKMPIDMQALDADFYAFSGHKLYGPTGIGVLYGKKALLEALPPFLGGGDMIESVTLEKTEFQPPPLKFEAGTPPIAQIVGLGAAIDYVQSVGMKKIHAWEQQLLSYATEKLLQVEGVQIYGRAPQKGGIISFTLDGVHPLDLGTLLGEKGVAIRTGHLCAQPLLKRFGVEALARLSFGLYTTYEEIDRFLEILNQTVCLLRG